MTSAASLLPGSTAGRRSGRRPAPVLLVGVAPGVVGGGLDRVDLAIVSSTTGVMKSSVPYVSDRTPERSGGALRGRSLPTGLGRLILRLLRHDGLRFSAWTSPMRPRRGAGARRRSASRPAPAPDRGVGQDEEGRFVLLAPGVTVAEEAVFGLSAERGRLGGP